MLATGVVCMSCEKPSRDKMAVAARTECVSGAHARHYRDRVLPRHRLQKHSTRQPKTSMAVVLSPESTYPVVAFGKSQFSVKSATDSVHTPMKKPLSVTKEAYFSVLTNKGVCSRAASKWEAMLTPNNCTMLSGKEGKYPYCAFDVIGHPEQKHKFIPVPADVAVKVFPKIHADATENPSKYGLKIDDPDPDIRARHKQRLDMFLWTPDMCAKDDADGKAKPCVISPPLNSWSQCPTVSQIPNLGKELVTDDGSKPKASTKNKGGKRKGSPSDVDMGGITAMTENLMPGMRKIVRIEHGKCTYTVTSQGGGLYVTLYDVGEPHKAARTAAPAAADDEEEDDERDGEEEGEEDAE